MLMVREAKGNLKGQWGIPWGVVERGEAPAGAVIRETLEEAGIDAEAVGLMGLQELQDGWIGLVFLCNHVSGDPRPDGVETDAVRYFTSDEIDALEEPFEPWCRWVAERAIAGDYISISRRETPYAPRVAFL